MLPASANRYYNFNFPFNLKLTYDYDLKYAEFILHSLDRELTDLGTTSRQGTPENEAEEGALPNREMIDARLESCPQSGLRRREK